ncbi:MAG: cell wall hydrolase [Lachnospiraceae bacterium]|nr:cell wall hydrolase [Lachnospiraceae bacterium]
MITKSIAGRCKWLLLVVLALTFVTAPNVYAAEDWSNKLAADVSDFLNIRESASTSAKIVGVLTPDAVAEVVEKGSKWTQIKSGDIEGYVCTSYCVFGKQAFKQIKNNCSKFAFAKNDETVVYSLADSESEALCTLSEGESLPLDSKAEKAEGFKAVTYDDETGYVLSKSVTVRYNYRYAMTEKDYADYLEESEPDTELNYGDGISYTDEELTWIAAIIRNEAGFEPYEGMVAVGAVIVNRVQSGRFPNTIYDVLHQRGQFGSNVDAIIAKRTSQITADNLKAAKEALDGADPTNGKLFFKAYRGSGSGQVIGGQLFY